MDLLLNTILLTLPFTLWLLPAHIYGKIAAKNDLSYYEYLMLGLLLAPLAPFILINEIRKNK